MNDCPPKVPLLWEKEFDALCKIFAKLGVNFKIVLHPAECQSLLSNPLSYQEEWLKIQHENSFADVDWRAFEKSFFTFHLVSLLKKWWTPNRSSNYFPNKNFVCDWIDKYHMSCSSLHKDSSDSLVKTFTDKGLLKKVEDLQAFTQSMTELVKKLLVMGVPQLHSNCNANTIRNDMMSFIFRTILGKYFPSMLEKIDCIVDCKTLNDVDEEDKYARVTNSIFSSLHFTCYDGNLVTLKDILRILHQFNIIVKSNNNNIDQTKWVFPQHCNEKQKEINDTHCVPRILNFDNTERKKRKVNHGDKELSSK